MDGLNDFIVMAKRATYAAAAAKSLPYRLGTSDLQFRDGPWSYHDSYVGKADFLGQEIVYRDRRPVWSMAYYGYLLDPEHIDAGQAGRTVQSALTSLYAEGRFLGGFVADVGEYRYVDTNAGDVERFSGEEWIERGGRRVYELRYFGGLVKF
jgi:Domain of unknown function (DUF5680)